VLAKLFWVSGLIKLSNWQTALYLSAHQYPGASAWWLRGLIHLGLLVGVRNRLATTVNWLWAYVTFGGGIRLITMSSQRLSNPDQ
jgi:NADH dehydrogenase FAD-containing subunit